MQEPGHSYKRLFDLTLLLLSHLFLLPIWLLLWTLIPTLIWLEDRGPVFYKQIRLGKNGKRFKVLKFRTMIPDAESKGPGWTSDNDERLTKVGKTLRKTALDELPQLVNLWRGDISFVGPRTLPVQMHNDYLLEEPAFDHRLQIRPGLTGLAQLFLSRHCSARKRLRYDLLYIHKSSLILDIKLVALSVWLTLTGKWGTGVRVPEEQQKVIESKTREAL